MLTTCLIHIGSRTSDGKAIPSNHSPHYAPEMEQTLEHSTDAMALAVLSSVVENVGSNGDYRTMNDALCNSLSLFYMASAMTCAISLA